MDISLARVSSIHPTSLRAVVLLFAISHTFGASQAAIFYTFSGQVPSNTDFLLGSHPKIAPGETWIATLVIDEIWRGTSWGGDYLIYYGAVKSGSLVFSGGYVSPIDFYWFNITVSNDSNDDVPLDYIGLSNTTETVHFSAMTDLSPLSSNNLPAPGTRIVPGPTANTSTVQQFKYSDSLGTFSYFGKVGTNISFAAFVPEPTSLALASLLGISFVVARRRR